MSSDDERHSVAENPYLIEDEQERAEREAQNGLLQFDAALQAIDTAIDPDYSPFKLRPSLALTLNRIALQNIHMFAGNYRPGPVVIQQSSHVPPEAHLVPELVEHMCDYINDNWDTMTAVDLTAYVMWRVNWIHPFADGNGRTARTLSYVVLCAKLGTRLPGLRTIPEQISENKFPYYDALEAADEADKQGDVDISALAGYLGDLLANQLTMLHATATGDSSTP